MSLRRIMISSFFPLEFTRLMDTCESERINREFISQKRAEIMAFHKTKVSTLRGENTKVAVAEWDEVDPTSSMIQASPAHFVKRFHVASVNMQIGSETRGGSWKIRVTCRLELWVDSWEAYHSRASLIAFSRVSIGVKSLFRTIN